MSRGKKLTGMVLGKFLPPHRGHSYLIDFAREQVDELHILLCTLATEPIPGELRRRWLEELFPWARVHQITDENPQEPADHPDFWSIWLASIRRVLPEGPDRVFASEPYGFELARRLGAVYVPVDHARELVPVSASAIREAPLAHWEFLPPPVRPHFLRRIVIFGPESTGKTTLARDLARHYRTVWVGEYARGYLDLTRPDGQCRYEDIETVARGQLASERALARQADRLLFCDTDLITTLLWSHELFGKCPEWVREQADRQRYDLYLLTDVDVPWVEDPQRYLPEDRRRFFDLCLEALAARHRPYTIVGGNWTARFTTATTAVDRLIKGDSPSFQF